ncbi:hypothetical protein GCM10028773_54410 [Spirosoma koreense]
MLTFMLTSLLLACKTTTDFSPGTAEPRITGTWRLYERRFPKDSSFTIRIKRDSLAIVQDTSLVKSDSIYVRRDTSYISVKKYSSLPSQTLTFDADGKLAYVGTEMTYYAPYKYYRIDKTYPDSLFINLVIQTNGASVSVRQGLEFRRDTLLLKPNCNDVLPCYSKLLRVR